MNPVTPRPLATLRPPAPLRPLRALTHPAWWVALAVLAINDHLIKGTQVLPQPVIGKLSDVAGLLVAPMLFATLLRVRTRRGVALAHAAIALGFAAINLWPAAARGFEAVMALTPWPWAIVVDPTDLLALPMVALSWAWFAPLAARPIAVAPALGRGAAILGGWACVATSPPPSPVVEPPPGGWSPDIQDRLVFANQSEDTVLLRVRPLRADVALDCDAVAADPGQLLGAGLFGPANTWELDPGRSLGLLSAADAPLAPCMAWRVDGAGLAPRLVFLPQGTWPRGRLSTDASQVPADRAIAVDAFGWGEHPALYAEVAVDPEVPAPACRLPAPGAGLGWSVADTSGSTLLAHDVSPDGCHRLLVDQGGWTAPWYLCLGGSPLPFEVGATLSVQVSVEGLVGETLQVTDGRQRLLAFRGAVQGGEAPSLLALGAAAIQDARDQPDCAPTRDGCAQWRAPAQVQLVANDSGERAWLGSGDSVEFETSTVRVVRAERFSALDRTCSPVDATFDPQTDVFVELVLVAGPQE